MAKGRKSETSDEKIRARVQELPGQRRPDGHARRAVDDAFAFRIPRVGMETRAEAVGAKEVSLAPAAEKYMRDCDNGHIRWNQLC